jgi:hypothetical protein
MDEESTSPSFGILKVHPPMHIKKQRLVTPGPAPLCPKALHAMMAAVQRVYAECAIAKKETVNA